MYLGSRIWATVTYAVNLLTFSPLDATGPEDLAHGLAAMDDRDQSLLVPSIQTPDVVSTETEISFLPTGGPNFKPPGGTDTGPDANFNCSYPTLGPDWYPCSKPTDRSCWLANDRLGLRYDIHSNYENPSQNPHVAATPPGVQRYYDLYLDDHWVNADGLNFTMGKIFNGSYPGPWIQACWGDNVAVTVHNRLKSNGTSIHWHGIRQYLTMHMDGVNGITQCPIAPGDSFTYNWTAYQYGSSWYHSHFSVQYADGALGPLTLHGPTPASFDEAVDPILMTDWGHNSAFEGIWDGLKYPTVLLNGKGNIQISQNVSEDSPIPKRFTISVEPPTRNGIKRYLLRLINTSFESTLIFSIDNHYLQIVGTDFVPIHPYWNTSVLVGIGQRYNVIVEATHPLPGVDNYWIRAERANCFFFPNLTDGKGYYALGSFRYGKSNDNPLTSVWDDYTLDCSDETYSSLKPVLPWKVGPAANNQTSPAGQQNDVEGVFNPAPSEIFPLAKFSLGTREFLPFQIDYSDPTFLHLNYTGQWNPLRVLINENYTADKWIYLIVTGDPVSTKTAGAHPIHLHGHDFAILEQKSNANFSSKTMNLKLDNPPRRDVVLLPQDGYVVIAFKADNPGVWLMHCHIAYHASFGLAMQIMENREAAAEIWPSFAKSKALNNTRDTCKNWNKWQGNCNNWWKPDGASSCEEGPEAFSPDSGI
ncbi:MAG: hypothetical protein Q9220_007227 [cf. Caloplaca sp. 1 TL-2023]